MENKAAEKCKYTMARWQSLFQKVSLGVSGFDFYPPASTEGDEKQRGVGLFLWTGDTNQTITRVEKTGSKLKEDT